MTSNAEFIVAAARTWRGTPFHHQGRKKGVGCDCLGMFIGMADELDLVSPESGERLANLDNLDYSSQPNSWRLVDGLKRHLKEVSISDLQPGDLILMDVYDNPQHVGIVTDYRGSSLGLLHSLFGQGVVEQRLDDKWHKRIRSVFRLTDGHFKNKWQE
jgi:NlpC/P60 family putative phage cell wall peptidase